jgi:fructose-bisphosphate aldolase, class II
VRQVAALIESIRQEYDFPIFLDADHTHSLAKGEEAARAGFDSIVFDRSERPFAENVSETRAAVEAIRKISPSILVEGEIGFIGSGSEIHEKVPEASKILTTPEDARRFIEATGVDVLAPAVGTMHGVLPSMIRGETQKRLNIERIQQIKKATNIFMTLHGGSGTNDEDFRQAIKAGDNHYSYQYRDPASLEARDRDGISQKSQRDHPVQAASSGTRVDERRNPSTSEAILPNVDHGP